MGYSSHRRVRDQQLNSSPLPGTVPQQADGDMESVLNQTDRGTDHSAVDSDDQPSLRNN